ncbi:hypothetical protein K501DRAFT_168208 [Backusella circina FSU 941]|nr:hypothetical protein K501DRAFT_168208 [Backusella circina FSU 941]
MDNNNPNHKVHQVDHGIDIPNHDNPFSVFDNEKVEVFDQTDLSFESMPADAVSQKSQSKRGLSARHIQMISLGGCIGTGLFLNSGQNIAIAGPAGALIAYCVGKF